MNIDSNRLQAFFEVAKTGSFSKAAQNLGLTQSALSHRIIKFEDDLQLTLFLRDSAGLKLTESGEALLRHAQVCESLEAELDSALGFLGGRTGSLSKKDSRTNGFAGVLRIGATSTLARSVVMPALKNLVSESPNLRVDIMVREIDELPKLLSRGAIDYVVSCTPIQKDELESHHLGFERYVMIESTRGERRKNVYLDHDSQDQTTIDFLKEKGRPYVRLERSYVDDTEGILTGVELGWGSAVVPLHLVEGRKGIKVVKSLGIMKTAAYLQHFRQSYYSHLHQEVVQTLKREVPRLLD